MARDKFVEFAWKDQQQDLAVSGAARPEQVRIIPQNVRW